MLTSGRFNIGFVITGKEFFGSRVSWFVSRRRSARMGGALAINGIPLMAALPAPPLRGSSLPAVTVGSTFWATHGGSLHAQLNV